MATKSKAKRAKRATPAKATPAKAEPKVKVETKEKKAPGITINVSKNTKNFACFIDNRYWRTYTGKDGLENAKNFLAHPRQGADKTIVDLDTGQVNEYEARKITIIRALEKQKEKMSASPGGMPTTWKRVFTGVPMK